MRKRRRLRIEVIVYVLALVAVVGPHCLDNWSRVARVAAFMGVSPTQVRPDHHYGCPYYWLLTLATPFAYEVFSEDGRTVASVDLFSTNDVLRVAFEKGAGPTMPMEPTRASERGKELLARYYGVAPIDLEIVSTDVGNGYTIVQYRNVATGEKYKVEAYGGRAISFYKPRH